MVWGQGVLTSFSWARPQLPSLASVSELGSQRCSALVLSLAPQVWGPLQAHSHFTWGAGWVCVPHPQIWDSVRSLTKGSDEQCFPSLPGQAGPSSRGGAPNFTLARSCAVRFHP